MNPSGDYWNAASDKIIEGNTKAEKMVDDILVQGENLEQLIESTRQILLKCREIGITISRKKFNIARKVNFVGYEISDTGIRPDPKNMMAISNFPKPKDVSGVRSFLGLANQFQSFLPDLAHNTRLMRSLLSKKNAFVWTEEHDKEFEVVKKLLTSDPVNQPFDKDLPTVLLSDASTLNGLGFALIQEDGENKRIVKCGSCALTDTQSRYAVIELEAMGIQYGLERCEYFLRGCEKLTVKTDHQPLVGIWPMEKADIINPRLYKVRERTERFQFDIVWVPGKKNEIADALSRYPVFDPDETLIDDDEVQSSICRRIYSESPITSLTQAAREDVEYGCLIEAINDKAFDIESKNESNHPAATYKKVWPRISVLLADEQEILLLDGSRVIVPKKARHMIMESLHLGHPGINKMYQKATQFYFWPNMHKEICDFVRTCDRCQEVAPSVVKTQITAESASFPMSHMGIDLFQNAGKSYVVMADRYSGYLFVEQLRRTDTEEILKFMRNVFLKFGFPLAIRSDGGPQFRGKFAEFCKERKIDHQQSSPFCPASNGLAESSVKQAKWLLKKVGDYGPEYQEHLCALMNTPRADGKSPAFLMFGRNFKEEHSMLIEQQLRLNPDASARSDKSRMQERERINNHKNKARRDLFVEQCKSGHFDPGAYVLVQNEKTGMWDREARVVEFRNDKFRSLVLTDTYTGQQFLRSVDKVKPKFGTYNTSGTHCSTSESSWRSGTPMTPTPPTNQETTQAAASSTCKPLAKSQQWYGSDSSPSWGLQPTRSPGHASGDRRSNSATGTPGASGATNVTGPKQSTGSMITSIIKKPNSRERDMTAKETSNGEGCMKSPISMKARKRVTIFTDLQSESAQHSQPQPSKTSQSTLVQPGRSYAEAARAPTPGGSAQAWTLQGSSRSERKHGDGLRKKRLPRRWGKTIRPARLSASQAEYWQIGQSQKGTSALRRSPRLAAKIIRSSSTWTTSSGTQHRRHQWLPSHRSPCLTNRRTATTTGSTKGSMSAPTSLARATSRTRALSPGTTRLWNVNGDDCLAQQVGQIPDVDEMDQMNASEWTLVVNKKAKRANNNIL